MTRSWKRDSNGLSNSLLHSSQGFVPEAYFLMYGRSLYFRLLKKYVHRLLLDKLICVMYMLVV